MLKTIPVDLITSLHMGRITIPDQASKVDIALCAVVDNSKLDQGAPMIDFRTALTYVPNFTLHGPAELWLTW